MYIITNNQKQDLLASNYWDSEIEARQLFYLSPNAGAIRLLVPRNSEAKLRSMTQNCDYVIVTRGRWNGAEAVEILFEDHSDNPFVIHLTVDSCQMLPGDPGLDRQWTFAIWSLNEATGQPVKSYEFECRWRSASQLPYLKPWQG